MTVFGGKTASALMLGLVAMAEPQTTRPPVPEPAAATALARLKEWRASRVPLLMDDFGELAHFRAANARLKRPAAGEDRVVFLGDSITSGWPLAAHFPGRSYVNRGIGGQTTAQMLLRFRPDVIQLRPRTVVISGGTNDIAGNTGPVSLDEIEGNFASMAELARAAGIRVVLAAVIPVHNYTPASDLTFPLRAPDKIKELNRWLKTYCAANGHVYLDYFAAMADDRGLLRRELADDGLHPNKAGYRVMAPLAEAAVASTLR